MKKQKPPDATKTVYPILRQIVNLIPPNIFHAAAAATKDRAMKDHLGGLCPEFVRIRDQSVLARFRKRNIHLLDSSTIQLVLNSIDWARHRARKAAAKLHMNYMLVYLLLRFLKFLAKWNLSFSRLARVVRAAVWVRRNVVRLLEMYGTAGGWKSDALM